MVGLRFQSISKGTFQVLYLTIAFPDNYMTLAHTTIKMSDYKTLRFIYKSTLKLYLFWKKTYFNT